MELGPKIEDENKVRDIVEARAGNAITIRDLEFSYTGVPPPVLNIGRLSIKKGERVAILGPSGAGKTTLMRLINGSIELQKGEIGILGEKFGPGTGRSREFRSRIGFIFQNFNLIDRASVYENVLWGRLAHINPLYSLMGWFGSRDKDIALRAIEEVDLMPQIAQRADTLSGGQLQRVAIARVLAQEPEIILADEPVSNLDPVLTDDIMELLVEVSENHNVTLVMNLHQTELAKRSADRIIGLRRGEVVHDSREGLLFGHVPKSIFYPEVTSLRSPKNRN